MTSKEIIKRVIHHDSPPRLGWDFHNAAFQDMQGADIVRLLRPESEAYGEWGCHPELSRRAGGFSGETRMDLYGNIIGRFEGRTKGECVLGAIQCGWELFDAYQFPTIDKAHVERARALGLSASEKYVLAGLPAGVFSILRDMRLINNALMDTVLEEDNVRAFLDRLLKLMVEMINCCADCGVDGVLICDDWGMQNAPFISPTAFRALFKPAYRALTDACHARGLDFMLHSCGCVLPLVDDMIEAGVDVLQFDQPELSGSAMWAERYGAKVAFYCPVDIQKIMATGDCELIERCARDMCAAFTRAGGSLIAKDYPTWDDIAVKAEWAELARKVIVANSAL